MTLYTNRKADKHGHPIARAQYQAEQARTVQKAEGTKIPAPATAPHEHKGQGKKGKKVAK